MTGAKPPSVALLYTASVPPPAKAQKRAAPMTIPTMATAERVEPMMTASGVTTNGAIPQLEPE